MDDAIAKLEDIKLWLGNIQKLDATFARDPIAGFLNALKADIQVVINMLEEPEGKP